MTTTIEDHPVNGAVVLGYTPGSTIGELELGPGLYAITIETDSLAVLYGTVEELVQFMTRAEQMLTEIIEHATAAVAPPAIPEILTGLVAPGEDFWTTDQMRELFEVEGFAAPFVVVRRKSDGAQGMLTFSPQPRFYYGWTASS